MMRKRGRCGTVNDDDGEPHPLSRKPGIDWVRNFGERRGLSPGPAAHWTYLHRTALRIGAVALAALIFVFLAEPTVLAVIVIVVVLLIVLGLIELIGVRPPAQEPTAGQAAS